MDGTNCDLRDERTQAVWKQLWMWGWRVHRWGIHGRTRTRLLFWKCLIVASDLPLYDELYKRRSRLPFLVKPWNMQLADLIIRDIPHSIDVEDPVSSNNGWSLVLPSLFFQSMAQSFREWFAPCIFCVIRSIRNFMLLCPQQCRDKPRDPMLTSSHCCFSTKKMEIKDQTEGWERIGLYTQNPHDNSRKQHTVCSSWDLRHRQSSLCIHDVLLPPA